MYYYLEFKREKSSFRGACSNVFHFHNNELLEVKGCNMPVGGNSNRFHDKRGFETVRLSVDIGDRFFMCSDGFVDQLGGPRNKKLNKKRFRTLLQRLATSEDFENAEDNSRPCFEEWKGEKSQIDDALLLGFRL